MELRYKLRSYGVPDELLPISHSGTLKFENHRSFLHMRHAKRNQDPNNRNYREIVEIPRSNDIIFRKGPSSKYNKGNEFYRTLLEEKSLEHFKGNKRVKYEITMSVIRAVESRKGRFLEREDDAWLVITNIEYARKKVAAGFKQYNRNFKEKDAQELLDTLHIAAAIHDNQSDNSATNVDGQDKDSRNVDRPIEISIDDQKRYAFIENPTKRHKTGHQKTKNDD